jgi:hypothetical protein
LPNALHTGILRRMSVVTVALLVLAIIGTALFCVALGIYNRLVVLTSMLVELRELAAGSQGELVKTQEGIGKVRTDLGRLVSNANAASEIVRSVTRLPTR